MSSKEAQNNSTEMPCRTRASQQVWKETGNGTTKPKDILINLKQSDSNPRLFSVLKVASSLKAPGLAYFKAAIVKGPCPERQTIGECLDRKHGFLHLKETKKNR